MLKRKSPPDEIDKAISVFKKLNEGKRKPVQRDIWKKEEEISTDSDDDNDMGFEGETNGEIAKARQIAKQYKFQQFDYNTVPLDAAILVVGKRRYGKSTWTDYFLSHRWQFYPDGGFCFTRTKFNYFWHQRFPESRIYEGMDWDVVGKILATQKEKVEAVIQNGEEKGKEDIPFVLIVLDDIISNQHDMRYEELLNEMMFSGRHYRVSIIINTQDIKGISPGARNNFDIVAMTYQTQERSIETLKGEYGDFFPNKKVFREIIKMNTQDHQMIIIDQTTAKYKATDCFFIDKANPHPDPYRIGDSEFWSDSGCDWEKQMKLFNNIPKHELDEWEEIAKRRWQKSLNWQKDDRYQLTSNNPYFSKQPPDDKPPKSHYRKALEIIRDKKFGVKYIPGKVKK